MKTNNWHVVLLLLLSLVGGIPSAQAFYNPTAGKWVNRDPIGEKGGVNLHAFVRNGPASFVDRNGLELWPAFIPSEMDLPLPSPGDRPINSQVNSRYAWHHTKHVNVVTGCCCTIEEMQSIAQKHLRTLDLFNAANTGSRVDVSEGHAQFTAEGIDGFVSGLIGNDIGVETTIGMPNSMFDLQATTEEWHPLIGKRRWGSEPVRTRLNECSTISIWTEAYEVPNNLNSFAEGKVHSEADTMWTAYLNAVGKAISSYCGGSAKGTSRVFDRMLPKGPIPW